jgi:hypothetical protein
MHDKRPNPGRTIIDEARRIAAEHGMAPTPYHLREILRLARGWIDDGMAWREAAGNAAALVLRPHAIDDAPWK